jgi:hypothetical protein
MKPHLWFVRAMSRLVPRRWRSEWRQEWDSELLHRESLGRPDVLRLVMSEGLSLVVIGAGFGIIGALGSTSYIESILFGLPPNDGVTISAASLLDDRHRGCRRIHTCAKGVARGSVSRFAIRVSLECYTARPGGT